MNLTAQKSRNFTNICCDTLRDNNVQQGIGAVLVLVGFALLVSGVIFTTVAYTNPRNGSAATFPYIGPVLIFIALSCMMGGFVLTRLDDIKQIRDYLKYRKRQTCVDNGETEPEPEIIGTFNVLCFKLLYCLYNGQNRANAHAQMKHMAANEQSSSGSCEDTKLSSSNVSRVPRLLSFTSLRQLKVHPSLEESSVV